MVGRQALKMRVNVQGTLEDLDPEYLHDLRVATRRLRSALRLFAEVLGPRRCDSLRVELNWIGRLLGAVRDLDVFIGNLRAQARRLGEAGTIAELLAEELGRQRVPEREALGAALASRRFRDLMRRLDALALLPASPSPSGCPRRSGRPGRTGLIGRAQKRVLKLGRSIGPDSPAADLHRLRILFKRLRYACEFFREAFADPASGTDPLADYLQAMVRFQDCLGEHHDAVVAMDRIQDLVKEMVQRGALAPERLLDLGGPHPGAAGDRARPPRASGQTLGPGSIGPRYEGVPRLWGVGHRDHPSLRRPRPFPNRLLKHSLFRRLLKKVQMQGGARKAE